MALSQNTLQRRKSTVDANATASVFRAGNIPVRRLANGYRIVAPTGTYQPVQPRSEEFHKAIDVHPNRGGRQIIVTDVATGAVEEAQQTSNGQSDARAGEHSTETSVDSPFSQMSITEQERERQPPQQQPPGCQHVMESPDHSRAWRDQRDQTGVT